MSELIKLHEINRWREIHICQGVDGLNPRTLIGAKVDLDGREVTVIAIETYAVMDPSGFNFGVVLDEQKSPVVTGHVHISDESVSRIARRVVELLKGEAK